MGVFSAIKEKFVRKVLGVVITDLGTFPTDEFGHQMTLSIRQRPGKEPHLQIRYFGRGHTHHFEVTRLVEWADQFEQASKEIRRHAK